MVSNVIPLRPPSLLALLEASEGLPDATVIRLIDRHFAEALIPSWERGALFQPQSDGWHLRAIPCGALGGPDHGGLTRGELPFTDADFEDGPTEKMICRAADIPRARPRLRVVGGDDEV